MEVVSGGKLIDYAFMLLQYLEYSEKFKILINTFHF